MARDLWLHRKRRKGRRWDETKIKALTAGDRISARFMRQDFFDFTPTFKLLIGGNHKPRLFTVDDAMKRRLLLLPFTVQIPAAERDKQLMDKLVPEHPAILGWCVEGCLQWQATGLAPPAGVTEATDAYFADQDTVGQWLEECTYDAGPAAFTRLSTLFESWKQWSEERNLKPGSTNFLSASGNSLHQVEVSVGRAMVNQNLVITEGVGHRVHCPICPRRPCVQRAEQSAH
jgi:P4 family phage/plasmid primase-like protien